MNRPHAYPPLSNTGPNHCAGGLTAAGQYPAWIVADGADLQPRLYWWDQGRNEYQPVARWSEGGRIEASTGVIPPGSHRLDVGAAYQALYCTGRDHDEQ